VRQLVIKVFIISVMGGHCVYTSGHQNTWLRHW